MSRWTIPFRCAKRSADEDLPRVVDRDPERRRAARDEQLLERPPLEVLHRDVVGALGLAAVVDRDDVRVREAGGVLRLAPEALDELLVARVPVVEDLDRDAPAELLVLGEIDVRHPARAELPDDQVAPVEERVDEGVGGGHGAYRLGVRRSPEERLQDLSCDRRGGLRRRSSSAARRRPRPRPRARSRPAKEMNQVVFKPGDAGLRRAGLAADRRRRRSAPPCRCRPRRRPPSSPRPPRAVSGLTARPRSRRAACGRRSSRPARRSGRRRTGCMTTPPFAIVAGDHRHLQRRHEQPLLAEREPARVDVAVLGFGSKSLSPL